MSTNQHTPVPGTGLVALSQEAARVEALLMELAAMDDGEIDAQLDAYLDEIKTKIAEKPDQYKYVMDRLGMASELLYAQANQFERAALVMESTVSRMKSSIKDAMEALQVDVIKGQTWQFKLGKAQQRLVIEDEAQFVKDQPQLVLVKTVYEIDRARLKEVLKAGQVIPGAGLEGGTSLLQQIVKAGK